MFEYETDFMSIEIENKMYEYRDNFLIELRKIVHPKYVNDFAKILLYSWHEDFQEAKTLAEDLNFLPIDFCAFSEDYKEFKEFFLKEIDYRKLESYG